MRPKILVTRRWPQAVERLLEERFDVTLNIDDRPMSEAAIAEALITHDAVLPTVSDRLPAKIFESPRIRARILGNFGVGYNHIDIAAARRAGLVVTNTPGVLTDATADLAMTLMLMITRRTGEGERELRAGHWAGWRPTHLIGASMKGKVLGIVGMGRIGIATARRAHFGFGMEILYSSRTEKTDPEIAELGARRVADLDALMAQSDIISLHCPGGAENRHLINAARINKMKSTAYLINTARGDVVDEKALIDALKERRIAGAGLDVYETEPVVPDDLMALDNVVLLPHLGSATAETRNAMGMKVVDNITAFFNGETPPDRVA